MTMDPTISARRSRRALAAGAAALACAALMATPSVAAEKVTYLFPAPPFLPAFGPIQVAKAKGYFKAAGIDVKFERGKGGVDVAKQVGVGNAELGGILADGPIIVRPNGVPIKTIAVFGGQGFMQIVARADAHINGPRNLKGKKVSVMSLQDTTYYVLQGVLASVGLNKSEVQIEPAGPAGVWKLVANGNTVACACVPDWIPPIQAAGVKVKIMPADKYFPSMAQAIGASDKIIKTRPKMVGNFVHAALKGMKDIMDDPVAAAKVFVGAVPMWKGKEKYIEAVFKYYDKLVYPGQKKLGEVNVERMKKVQAFYVKAGIARKAVPLNELYTNQFIK
jgi:NitT/TauT family transport system substrate-binding protein